MYILPKIIFLHNLLNLYTECELFLFITYIIQNLLDHFQQAIRKGGGGAVTHAPGKLYNWGGGEEEAGFGQAVLLNV